MDFPILLLFATLARWLFQHMYAYQKRILIKVFISLRHGGSVLFPVCSPFLVVGLEESFLGAVTYPCVQRIPDRIDLVDQCIDELTVVKDLFGSSM